MWRYWAMLWQAGGSILTPRRQAGRVRLAGRDQGADLLQTLAQHKAIYLDNGSDNYLPRVHVGPHRDAVDRPVGPQPDHRGQATYGVQILPARREPPDDLGSRQLGHVQQRRRARATPRVEFLKWFTSPAIDLQVGDDDRRPADPRRRCTQLPATSKFVEKYPGIGDVGRRTCSNATQTRPVTTDLPEDLDARSGRRSSRCCSARPAPAGADQRRPAGQRHPRRAELRPAARLMTARRRERSRARARPSVRPRAKRLVGSEHFAGLGVRNARRSC